MSWNSIFMFYYSLFYITNICYSNVEIGPIRLSVSTVEKRPNGDER